MTKNRSIKIAVLVLALALITSCFVGTTFAKYTSTATGTGEAEVAKWSIFVNETNELAVANKAFSFDLFDTAADDVTLVDGTNNDTPTTTADTDVLEGKIAPGTTGAFAIKIENKSDVNAEYTVDFSMASSGTAVPLLFKLSEDDAWETSIDDLDITEAVAIAMTNGVATINIDWMWDFHGANDTAIGIEAPTVTITAEIAVSQVN